MLTGFRPISGDRKSSVDSVLRALCGGVFGSGFFRLFGGLLRLGAAPPPRTALRGCFRRFRVDFEVPQIFRFDGKLDFEGFDASTTGDGQGGLGYR